jgi:transmembrane protein 231
MVEVYAEPLCRRHYSSLISWAIVVRVLLLIIAIACALVIAYATGGFWVQIKPSMDQATVQYTQDALLLVEVRFCL